MMSATTIHGIAIVRSRRLFFSTSSSSYHHRPRPRHPTTNDGGRNNNNNNNRSNSGSNDKDLFTPSPFKHGSCNININEDYSVVRCLLDSYNTKKDVYGMRRYLLLPRQQSSLISSSNYSSAEEVATLEKEAIASINANANVLFGARLHHHHHHHQNNNTLPSSNIIDESFSNNNNDNDELYYNSQYFFACGTLLDIAKEDASINGQQVQALAALDGLCHWARQCLSNNGEGSSVLTGLIHGYTYVDDDNCSATTSLEEEEEEEAFRNNNNNLNKSATTTTTTTATTTTTTTSSLRRGKNRSVSVIESSSLEKSDEKQRQKILEAITAIATGKPRKGHSIIGAGTYRDGMIGWMALSREYALLSSSSSSSSNATLTTAAIDYIVDDDYTNTTANPTFSSGEVKGGSREISLYKSRNGEVTKIEHLACTTPEYLIEAGGAMARIFFV